MQKNEHRDAIIRKIQALRARAEDAASSENEAAMAARKAAELLEKHNLSIGETEVRADGIEQQMWRSGRRTKPYEAHAALGIMKATNTDGYKQGGNIAFIGSPADVEAALYYADLTHHAINACWKAYRKSDEYRRACEWESPKAIAHAFKIGVAGRLGQRFKEMAEPEPTAGATGTSLVPLKKAMIRDWMHDEGIRLTAARRSRVSSGSAYRAGQRAGEGVSLTRGVGVQRSGQALLA